MIYATNTISQWQTLFDNKNNVDVIFDCWNYLTRYKLILIYAYVIMPNHVHWLLENISDKSDQEIFHSFSSFTAKQLLKNISNKSQYKSEWCDRNFQIWKSNPMYVDIFSKKFYYQKVNYIHNNPIRKALCETPQEYELSSYKFYLGASGKPDFLSLFWV